MIGNTFSPGFNFRGVHVANFVRGVTRHLRAKETCEVRYATQGRL